MKETLEYGGLITFEIREVYWFCYSEFAKSGVRL